MDLSNYPLNIMLIHIDLNFYQPDTEKFFSAVAHVCIPSQSSGNAVGPVDNIRIRRSLDIVGMPLKGSVGILA